MPPTSLNTAIIAFGSNKGDSKKYIKAAIESLSNLGTVQSISPLFITEPQGYAQQNNFLNGVLILKTDLTPKSLLKELKNIEAQTGRTPTFKNGPREIDLDIIFYNDLILEEENLVIPHPLAHLRNFVLTPLSFIAPAYKHPVLKEDIKTLLSLLPNPGKIQKLEN